MPSVTDTALIQGRILFFVFLMAGCALSFFFGSIQGWIFLTALAVAMILLGNPRSLLLVYAVWITVLPYLNTLFSDSRFLKWSDEAMAGALLAILLFNTEYHRRRPELVWINRSLVVLLCLIGISGVVNQVPWIIIFHFCLQYMRWYLIFYAAYFFVGNRAPDIVYRMIVLLFLLQLVPNIGWLLGINPMTNWMSGPDIAMGLGMGANVVGYYSIAFTCLGLAWAGAAETPRKWTMGVVMMVVGVVQLYFSYTIHAYFILPICLLVQLVTTGLLRRYFHVAGLVISGCVLIFMVIIAFSNQLSSEYLSNMTPDYIKGRWMGMWEGPKGQAYVDVVRSLPHDIPFPLIGAGPGNAGSNVAMQNRRPLADQYFNWVLLSSASEYLRLSEGSSVTSGPHTGVLAILSELGPLGFLAFWGVHTYACLRIWKKVRARAYGNRVQAVLAEAFVPTLFMLLLLAWIADYWYSAFVNNMIWIWAAAVWIPIREDEAAPTSATV